MCLCVLRCCRLTFDRSDPLITGGKNVMAYMEELTGKDAIRDIPHNLVLFFRASFMLRGLGHQLNQHRSAAQAWAPQAERVLMEAGEDPKQILA